MNQYFADMKDDWITFASRAIAARSLSGQEKDCADLFLSSMETTGIECFRDAVGNAIGVIRGNTPGPNILLTGHMDVVPAGDLDAWEEFMPFEGKVKNGKLYGRGISDMLGGLCCAFFAFCEIKKAVNRGFTLKGNLIFAGIVQEEPAECFGAKYAVEHSIPEHNLTVDAVYLAEPSKGDICLGHRGKIELVIDVHGKVAHSSTPSEGISALEKSLPVITAAYHDFYEPVLTHPTGHTTMAITDVELTPGKTYSCVPDLCRIRIDRRYVPPMTLDDVLTQIQHFLDKQAQSDPDFKAEVYPSTNHRIAYTGYEADVQKYHPFWSVDETNPYVQICKKALNAVGQYPKMNYWQFGTDGSAFAGMYHIPTIGYSCANDDQAHQPKEHVIIDDMLSCIEGYTSILCEIYGFDLQNIINP